MNLNLEIIQTEKQIKLIHRVLDINHLEIQNTTERSK